MKSIARNKKALHDYFIEKRFEAGLVLQGWEVKSLRAGKAQLQDSYVVLKGEMPFLLNAHISALTTVSTHITPNPTRSRKLLLHRKEIKGLIGTIKKTGYTLIPLSLYWKNNKAKLEFAIAKGKKLYDKRQSEKTKDWNREKQRLLHKSHSSPKS